MADFETALKVTGRNEGGYANNKNDNGGETDAGISRKFWPNWPGWKIVYEKKLIAGNDLKLLNHLLLNNSEIQSEIDSFYKANFWDVNRLYLITDQKIANTVYDFGVNSGAGHAAKYLQQSIGVNVDGIIGLQTITAVNASNGETTYNTFNALRRAFYFKLVEDDPSQKEFLNSWLSRLTSY